MGAFLGLVAGVGLVLAFRLTGRSSRQSLHHGFHRRMAEVLAQAGYDGLRPEQLYGLSAIIGAVAFVVVGGISQTVSIAVAFAGFASYLPIAVVRRRQRQRSSELRAVWPDVVDNLASAVRAGMALPEALAQLAFRGPEQLRPAFAGFATDYRATGRFGDCLDRLKAALGDPVADRIVESLRIAREVGGSDLGRLLRTLSQFLREDARTRAELETRQGWTVGAARLALAAPWVVLGMLALRPETVSAYDSPAGVAILVVGGAVSFAAYRVMLRIGRLPDEPRVLR
jgi:tight adherence protein B